MRARQRGTGKYNVRSADLSACLGHSATRNVILTFLALYPAFMILLASGRGPGITPDSVVYVSAARNLARAGKLIDFLGEPLTLWPPGFPWLLSLFERVGVDSQGAAIGINMMSAMLTVVLTYAIATAALASRALALLAAAIVATSASTVRVYSMLWTEPLFTVLTLSVLILLVSALRSRDLRVWKLLVIASLVSAATLVRIAGLWLVPVTALVALVVFQSKGWGRAVGAAAAAGLTSSVGLGVVVLRNVMVGAPALGERYAAGMTLKGLIVSSLETLGRYVVPPLDNLDLVTGLLIIAILVVGILASVRDRNPAVALLAAFTGLYWVSLWYSQLATGIDATSERLTAPILAPMVCLAIYGLRWLGTGEDASPTAKVFAWARDRGVRRWVSVSVLLVIGVTSVSTAAGFVLLARAEGLGYNQVSVKASPLASAVRRLPADAEVAANDYSKIYWVSQRQPVTVIPWTGYYFPPAKAEKKNAELLERIRSGRVSYLAYFDALPTVLAPTDFAALGCNTSLVSNHSDGSLWSVSACP